MAGEVLGEGIRVVAAEPVAQPDHLPAALVRQGGFGEAGGGGGIIRRQRARGQGRGAGGGVIGGQHVKTRGNGARGGGEQGDIAAGASCRGEDAVERCLAARPAGG